MYCSLCRIFIILGHLPADSVRGIQWSQKSRRSPCTRIDCCTAGRRGRGWVSSSGNQMVALLLFLCHNDCTISDTVCRPGESSLINYFHLEVSTALVWCHWIFSRYPNAVTGQSMKILIHLIFWLFLNTFLTPPPTGTRPRLLTEWNVLSQNLVHSLTQCSFSPCLGLCVQSQHYFST